MAHFLLTDRKGTQIQFEGSLLHAQAQLELLGPGATLQLLHPGASGHGQNHLDY